MMPISTRRYFGRNFENYRQKKIAARTKPIPYSNVLSVKQVTIIGLFSAPTGLGNAALLLKKELCLNNIKILEVDCIKIFNSPEYLAEVKAKNFINSDAVIFAINPDIAINIVDKINVENLIGKKIIGYFVWELDIPPKKWSLMSNFIHEIWTPSEFSRKSLSKIFKHSIKLVHHPVALMPPNEFDADCRTKTREKIGVKEDSFVALQSIAFSSSLERKNTIEAIEIFLEAFKNIDNSFFIVRYTGDLLYPNSLNRLQRAAKNGNGKIILIKATDETDEIFKFYAASDIYISLHRSEGFGLNIAEAMLVKLPVMASNWSGNLELCNSDNCLLVDCSMTNVRDREKIYDNYNAMWAKPNKEQAISKLKYFYENINYRKQIADCAQNYIKSNFGASKLF